jgi:hypothetical protein
MIEYPVITNCYQALSWEVMVKLLSIGEFSQEDGRKKSGLS